MKTLTLLAALTMAVVSLPGCVSVGGGTFYKPSEGFQPKKTYNVSVDTLWQKINLVLQSERISVVSSDKAGGRIITDYVEGPTQMQLVGSPLTTRYKYNITLNKLSDSETSLMIICTLESSSEGIPWHDVSKDNQGIVSNLENWLYEQIEKSI